jgi:hypothetical protein
MWGGISALAVATGPSLGSVPIALVAGLATRRLVPESIIGGRVPDLVGVVMLSGAVASIALAITQGGDWGWSNARILGLFVLAAVLAPIAVRRSARHPAPASTADALTRFHTAWLVGTLAVLGSAAISSLHRRPAAAAAPVAVLAPAVADAA